MKHCHFSILYNEIAFLKQKMAFLYQHFDQIIFYDLNIVTSEFSNDGSHEFIKEYPDPDGKITLIEERDLESITEYRGGSFVEKRKMFSLGSKFVKDDNDYFWCTDMDEFFNASFIESVEKNIGQGEAALIPHIVFFKDDKWIGTNGKNSGMTCLPWARVARHIPGHMYGHCTLHEDFKVKNIDGEFIYHFAFIGKERLELKSKLYNIAAISQQIKETDKDFIKLPSINGYYRGIIRNKFTIPTYINVAEMLKDLK